MVYSGAPSAPSTGITLDLTWKNGSCLSGRKLLPHFIPHQDFFFFFFFLPSRERSLCLLIAWIRSSSSCQRWNWLEMELQNVKVLSTSGPLQSLTFRASSWEPGMFINVLPVSNSEPQCLSHQHHKSLRRLFTDLSTPTGVGGEPGN